MNRASEGDRGRADRPRMIAFVGGPEAVADEIREGLEASGVPCSYAADVVEVLRSVDQPAVRLFVIDVEAVPAARRIQENVPAGRLLLLLSPGQAPEASNGGEAGPHYLTRPFASETLAALVRHLVEGDVPSGRREYAAAAVQARVPRPFAPYHLYEKARQRIAAVLDRARSGELPDIDDFRPLAEEIHTDLLRSNLLVTRSLEPHQPYDLATHCLNVAIIGGKISMGLASPVEDILRVIEAGLIHDVGMTRLPEPLLRKPAALDDEERAELHRHPVYAAELVETLGPRFEWMATALLQEHERASGQGYPTGLVASQIDPVARVLGVADVFEALSHPRVYRSPFTGLEALETVVGMQDEYFEPRIVQALVNEISAFPLDSYVQLSSGEIGRVIATNPTNILRPTVEVWWDAEWRAVETPYEIDLANRPEISVARALLEAELPIT